ncbi:MAG: hypothetical protein ABF295_06755 [Flavobacteriaceae bacterium]
MNKQALGITIINGLHWIVGTQRYLIFSLLSVLNLMAPLPKLISFHRQVSPSVSDH